MYNFTFFTVKNNKNTGWKPVTRGEKLDFDLETTPLYLKTDSAAGSGEQGKVGFYTASGGTVGGFILNLSSPPQYALWYCVSWQNFHTDPPSETDKVLRITLTRTSGIRVVVHYYPPLCN